MTVTDLAGKVLSAPAARELTDRINRQTVELWRLVLEAHDQKAWEALGYRSWKAYVEAELEMSRPNAYRILSVGHVRAALEAEANGSSFAAQVGEAAKHVNSKTAPVLAKDPERSARDIAAAVAAGAGPAAAVVEAVTAATPPPPPPPPPAQPAPARKTDPIEARSVEKPKPATQTPVQMRLFAVVDELRDRVEAAARRAAKSSDQWLRDVITRELDRQVAGSRQVTPLLKGKKR